MSDTPLRLFVYGTLKRGQRSHAHFCGGAASIEPATVLGQLFHLPAGYPMLAVPERSIVAVGTGDPLADMATQRQWDEQAFVVSATAQTHSKVEEVAGNGNWEPIEGEVLSFPDPAVVLPRLDRFEEFRPESDDTAYIRGLVRIEGTAVVYVWTYVAPGGKLPPGARRIDRRWP